MIGSLEKKRISDDSQARAFEKGKELCWYIFGLSLIFFCCWYVGHTRENYIISNGTTFSKAFFHLNPNIFKQVFLAGNILSYLSGAANQWSFIFLVCYLICVTCFVGIVGCCAYLFIISYNTSIRPFHYVACLGIFPIISCFLISWHIFKLLVFQLETKKNGKSRYSKDFEPEIFGDPILEKLTNIEDLSYRPVTTEFGKIHYDKFFKGNKKSVLMDIHNWLSTNLT